MPALGDSAPSHANHVANSGLTLEARGTHAPHGPAIALRSGLRYDQLLEYVRRKPALSILEIGVARAANALRMLAYANSLGGRAKYVGIDLFDSITPEQFKLSHCVENKRPWSREATLTLLQEQLGPEIALRCYLFEGLSGSVLPVLHAQNFSYDLIFIDGGHDYEAVAADWHWSQRLINPGGTIVFDDFPNWGVRGVVAEIDRKRWQVEILPHTDVFHGEPSADEPRGIRMHMLVAATLHGSRSNG